MTRSAFTRNVSRVLTLSAATSLLIASIGCVQTFAPTVQTDFTTPVRTLDTIASAMMMGRLGARAYSSSLADSLSGATPFGFYAFADPGVLANWQLSSAEPPFDPGDLEHERLFFSNSLLMIYPNFTYQFQWSEDPYSPMDEVGPDAAMLHRRYALQATSRDGRIQKLIAIGYADLALRKHNGRWWLTQWTDRVDPTIGITPVDPENRTMGWRRLDS